MNKTDGQYGSTLLLQLVCFLSAVIPTVADAELLIDIARQNLPDRTECRTDFRSQWEREFRLANEKFQIYYKAWSDLKAERANLEAATSDAEFMKTVSDYAIAVKLIAGLTNTGLGEAAKVKYKIPAELEKGMTIVSATIDWVVDELRSGRYSIGQMINSFASDEFHAHVLTSLAADSHPLSDAAKQMFDFASEYERQESEYAEYRKTLNQLIDDTEKRIDDTKRSMKQEQDRLFNLYHRAFEIFCENSPPTAKDDREKVNGTDEKPFFVLSNDEDPEGRVLKIRNPRVSVGSGHVRIGQDLSLRQQHGDYLVFSAGDDFEGRAVVEYEIVDDLGEIAGAKVYIDVAPEREKEYSDDALLDAALQRSQLQIAEASAHDASVQEALFSRDTYASNVLKDQQRKALSAVMLGSPGTGGVVSVAGPSGFGSSSGNSEACMKAGQFITDAADQISRRPESASGICEIYRGLAQDMRRILGNPNVQKCPEAKMQATSILQQAESNAANVCM